jgi:phenylalanyl-tRNA synthetase beta subunit
MFSLTFDRTKYLINKEEDIQLNNEDLFDKLEVGKVCEGIIDIYPSKTENRVINITSDWINNKLGSDIKKEEMIDIVSNLGFKVKNNKKYPIFLNKIRCLPYSLFSI